MATTTGPTTGPTAGITTGTTGGGAGASGGATAGTERGRDGDLPTVLIDQIELHWHEHLRPRLQGLTDEEYFFDPTGDGDIWTVHPRRPDESARPDGSARPDDPAQADGSAQADDPELPRRFQAGSGDLVIDFEVPEPTPAPFTTIAWRLGHIIVGVLATRTHSHHGGPAADYMSWDYAATAEGALAQLDTEHDRWIEGVRRWDADDLQVAVGEAEGPWAEYSRATLVAHINRELIHHLAEIALLRDLFAHRR